MWDCIALSLQYVINPARRLTTYNRLIGAIFSSFEVPAGKRRIGRHGACRDIARASQPLVAAPIAA
jgi:hypothetical protein